MLSLDFAQKSVNQFINQSLRCRSALMQNTFNAMEPLPRLCPVDIPVLFGGATSSSNTTATAEEYGDGAGDRDEQDALFTELDACMRVLEDIKPKVGTGRRNFGASPCINGQTTAVPPLDYLPEGGGGHGASPTGRIEAHPTERLNHTRARPAR